jgi:hypothetical protein
MKMITKIVSSLSLLCAITTSAQLAVTVSPPKIAGQKAVVELNMKNGLAENIKSARAICFLLDEHGKMVGESAKWIIGGTKNRPALEPKKEASFNIIITSSRPFTTTNLTAKVSFSRLILEDGKSVNPNEEVTIEQQSLPINQVSPTNNLVASKSLDAVIASASTSSPITIKPIPRTAGTIMVANLLQPTNHSQLAQPK